MRRIQRRPWRERADEAMRFLIDEGRPFSSDDLRALVGDPDPNGTANSANSAIGSLFQRFSRDGLIEQVGISKSAAVKRKRGVVMMWQRKRSRLRRKVTL